MKSIDIKVNVSSEVISDLLGKYIKENMSNESYEIYLQGSTGHMHAASAAMRNEVVSELILEGYRNDGNMSKA